MIGSPWWGRVFLAAVVLVPATRLNAQAAPAASVWGVNLGAAALIVPRYPGSDEFRVLPLPRVFVTFRNRLFLGPSPTGPGLGLVAYSLSGRPIGLTVEAGLLDSRPAARADALVGTNDRHLVATVGASLTYSAGPVEGLLRLVRGVNDGAGFLATTRVSFSRPLARHLFATVGLSATLADGRQMRRDFGVSVTEAGRRQALINAGDPRLRPDEGRAYQPEGGLRQAGGAVSLVYVLSPRWSVVGFGGADWLSAEAARSPLVRRREQFSGGLSLGYRF